jgi:hypothetical protein
LITGASHEPRHLIRSAKQTKRRRHDLHAPVHGSCQASEQKAVPSCARMKRCSCRWICAALMRCMLPGRPRERVKKEKRSMDDRSRFAARSIGRNPARWMLGQRARQNVTSQQKQKSERQRWLTGLRRRRRRARGGSRGAAPACCGGGSRGAAPAWYCGERGDGGHGWISRHQDLRGEEDGCASRPSRAGRRRAAASPNALGRASLVSGGA